MVTSNSSEQPSQQRTTSALQRSNHSSSSGNNNNTTGLFSQIHSNVELSAISDPGEVLLAELYSDSGFRSSSGKFLHKLIITITYLLVEVICSTMLIPKPL
jgi:hypothetical protein